MAGSPAAANAVRLLNILGRVTEPVGASELARELGLPRSTTYRLLTTLAEFAYVVHVQESGRYALGIGAYELASAYQRQAPLRRIAGPVVSRLMERTTYSAHFGLLQGKDVLYLIEERAAGRPSLVTDVGVRLPAEITASGRAMLALLPGQQVTALYPSAEVLVDRTGQSPRTVTALRRILGETRRRGWGQEVDAVTVGLSSVAVAVRDRQGLPIASVALTYPTDELGDAARDELVDELRRAASAIAYRVDPRTR